MGNPILEEKSTPGCGACQLRVGVDLGKATLGQSAERLRAPRERVSSAACAPGPRPAPPFLARLASSRRH